MSDTPRRPPLTPVQLQRLNIGPRYHTAEVADIPTTCSQHGVVNRYVSRLAHVRSKGYGLLLWGENSTGKTFAAAAILKEVVRAGFTGYCIPSTVLREAQIEKTRFDEDQTIQERAETVDFLVIEDLGKEYRAASGFIELQFENLLRRRTQALRPVIITTNFSIAEFKEVYNLSAAQLALEMLYPVQCRGVNFREQIRDTMKSTLGATKR